MKSHLLLTTIAAVVLVAASKKQNSIQWKDWIVIDLDIDPNFSAALSWEDQAAKQINLLSYSDSKLDSKFKADQYFMGYTTKIRSTVLFKE